MIAQSQSTITLSLFMQHSYDVFCRFYQRFNKIYEDLRTSNNTSSDKNERVRGNNSNSSQLQLQSN